MAEGIIGFVKDTPDALKATVQDTRASGPIEGLLVKGSTRLWSRLVNAVKTIGKGARGGW